MPWDTVEFKQLQKKWYDKLARKGFKDIENERGELLDSGKPLTASKAEYFRQVESRLHTTKWDHKVDRFVMEATAEGWTRVEISKALKKKRLKCHVETIRLIIRKYEALWGIRKWAVKDMK